MKKNDLIKKINSGSNELDERAVGIIAMLPIETIDISLVPMLMRHKDSALGNINTMGINPSGAIYEVSKIYLLDYFAYGYLIEKISSTAIDETINE